MGRVRAAAHQGRGHAVAHDRRRAVLARLLRSRLRRGLFVRPVLHLQAAARRTDRRRESHPGRHRQAADGVRRQCRDGDRQHGPARADERHGTEQSCIVLGRRDRLRDPALRRPGRPRSRRRRAVRHDRGGGAPGPDDGHDRPVLGRQRDVAGGDRRRALRRVSRRLCGVPRRVLPPGAAAAARA